MAERIEKLIELYEEILYGNDDSYGLFDCYDTYYKGCWDEKLDKVKELIKEIKNLHGK